MLQSYAHVGGSAECERASRVEWGKFSSFIRKVLLCVYQADF